MEDTEKRIGEFAIQWNAKPHNPVFFVCLRRLMDAKKKKIIHRELGFELIGTELTLSVQHSTWSHNSRTSSTLYLVTVDVVLMVLS